VNTPSPLPPSPPASPALSGLGQALRWLREKQTRKQYRVADSAGITKGMLSAYETGRQRPSLETLEKLLETLGCDLNDLHNALQIVNGRPERIKSWRGWQTPSWPGGPSPQRSPGDVLDRPPGSSHSSGLSLQGSAGLRSPSPPGSPGSPGSRLPPLPARSAFSALPARPAYPFSAVPAGTAGAAGPPNTRLGFDEVGESETPYRFDAPSSSPDMAPSGPAADRYRDSQSGPWYAEDQSGLSGSPETLAQLHGVLGLSQPSLPHDPRLPIEEEQALGQMLEGFHNLLRYWHRSLTIAASSSPGRAPEEPEPSKDQD
jgi:DNA-binding XRE family transcriptional regulator